MLEVSSSVTNFWVLKFLSWSVTCHVVDQLTDHLMSHASSCYISYCMTFGQDTETWLWKTKVFVITSFPSILNSREKAVARTFSKVWAENHERFLCDVLSPVPGMGWTPSRHFLSLWSSSLFIFSLHDSWAFASSAWRHLFCELDWAEWPCFFAFECSEEISKAPLAEELAVIGEPHSVKSLPAWALI